MRKVFGIFIFFLIAFSGIGQDKKKPYEGLPSLVWPKLIDINVVVRTDQYGEYDAPVWHRPHGSRPWKQLKYSNPMKYYFFKFWKGLDKI